MIYSTKIIMILLCNQMEFFGSLLKLSKHIYFIDVYELICKSCTLKGLGHETEFTYLDKNN
jgi:hypothetical protein